MRMRRAVGFGQNRTFCAQRLVPHGKGAVAGITGCPGKVFEEVAAEAEVFPGDLKAVQPVAGPVGDHPDAGGCDALVHLLGTGNLEVGDEGRGLARHEGHVVAGDTRGASPMYRLLYSG